MISDGELIAALESNGWNRAETARSLGIDLRGMLRRIKRLEAKGRITVKPSEAEFKAKAFSTLKDGDGNVKLVWEKTERDNSEAALRAIRDGFIDQIPKAVPLPKLAKVETGLLNQFTVTDYHLGMLSWHEESGADWDLTIAENLILRWFATAIRQAPDADMAVFCQLGDFLHYDSLEALTPASKHVLDADSRYPKVVRAAIRIMRTIINLLLKKYPAVHVICAEGNHDPAGSIWLREWLDAYYENEPRLTVETSPDPYYCVEWGETSLFYHHGHKRKPTNVDSVFTSKFREVFGRTKHSYAHMGHMHHIAQLETNLMVVEQHRTLAAPDAYASRGGWSSGRDAQVITYHRKHGEVGRIRLNSNLVME
jgi:DNA-binding Lrp family transcriptional regulator